MTLDGRLEVHTWGQVLPILVGSVSPSFQVSVSNFPGTTHYLRLPRGRRLNRARYTSRARLTSKIDRVTERLFELV
jgi:hypothetical protein